MWCHSCNCLEGQRKFTEGTCEDKLSLIPVVNSGTSRYEVEVPFVCWNFLFYIWLIWILCHIINSWYLSIGKCLSCHWLPYCSDSTIPVNEVLIWSVGLLPSAFDVFRYMLDVELFPHRHLIYHGEHFVSIVKIFLRPLCVSHRVHNLPQIS